MEGSADRAIAIVGLGAVLPDAPNVASFWENIRNGRYSISETPKDRWDPDDYYDPDPAAPDKTYSKIGGWVREFTWDPMAWRLPIPPRVGAAMDDAQKWAVGCTRAALEDYGYPKRALDPERTAVILGNALAGEKQYLTVLRAYFPEYAHLLEKSAAFSALPGEVRAKIASELHERMAQRLPEITEDTMPGELANCIAGRIANLFNFHGPNYVVDAACASAMAAMSSACEALVEREFDVAVTGGVDRNMGPSTYIKFCKIGALSATGSRPYAEGADGFVMGEGTVIFLLKRLADAERNGDKIYAVLRGIGGASDGKGKGITAPNPVGQKLAVERAWQNAGISPATVGLVEGHGTSTKVGDVVEVQSMLEAFSPYSLATGSVALGSVKSNIGHLKAAAGAAGVLKAVLSLHHKALPPSVNCPRTNPDIDFSHAPFYVNRELKPWDKPAGGVRCAAASAFGFGGTNFHMVFEEYVPGRINGNGKRSIAVDLPAVAEKAAMQTKPSQSSGRDSYRPPLRGALLIGAYSDSALTEHLRGVHKQAEAGHAPAPHRPHESDLRAPVRLAIDYADAAELAEKSARALKALEGNNPATWRALRARGIFRGEGPAAKVAFLYTGQGSQYVNMLQPLRNREAIVTETFAEADRRLTPLLGKPLTEFIFVDKTDPEALARAEDDLRQTAITQPAVLSVDIALTRLLAAYGIEPDFVMGHSLGEYGALAAAGAMPFGDALEAVSARGREMTRVSVADNGRMAAIFAPLAEIERVLKTVGGYVVIANINSEHQAVIGGASEAVERAMDAFQKAGHHVIGLPVSHAFHTSIVAPASEPLRQVLQRLQLQTPRVPVIANITGEFYPARATAGQIVDILARQVASPVQFVKGLRTLHGAGARVFVECGPKRALQGFVDDVFTDAEPVVSLATNHPKNDVIAFNQALCGLYAAGLGNGHREPVTEISREAGELRRDENASREQPVGITGAALGLPGTEHIFDDANIGRILDGEQFIGAIPADLRQAMLAKNVTRLVKSDQGEPRFETITDPAEVIKLAGRGRAFDLEKEFGVSAERITALDRTTQLAIAAGIDALRDAGIPLVMRYKTTSKGTRLPDRWLLPESMRDDTGVIFASAFPGYDRFADDMSRYYTDLARRRQLAELEQLRAHDGESKVAQELDRRIAKLRAAIAAEPYCFDRRFLFRILAMGHSQFAEYIGARGPNTQVNAACASTTQAIALAEDWIRAGRCRRVIVVSADDVTSDRLMEWIGAGFLATGAAATDEDVREAAIPFDRRRHGMLIGMGAAAMVVESAEASRERGVAPICEVLGAVAANSAYHGTRLDVNHIGDMMERLISQAESQHQIRRDQIAPRTVFVSHETYTPARGGSASAEIFALRRVFGEAADRVVIANTKGFTGHAMATGIEDVVAVKSLETGCVPPVPNFQQIDPELGALNLSKGGDYPVEYALRLAAGFGSQICMTLLRWVPARDGVRRRPEALGHEYRIVDAVAWQRWTEKIAGHAAPDLEVVQRTLRVHEDGVTSRAPRSRTEKHAEPAQKAPVPQAAAPAAPTPAVQPVTPPLAPAVVAPSSHAASPAKDVQQQILGIVAQKTGYPPEMLDLDLDLEADLGVDTVKQAEIFASVREAYGIPRDDQLKLRDFPTLAHVIRFVHERRPELQQPVLAAKPVDDTPRVESPAVPPPAKAIAPPVPPAAAAMAAGTDAVRERVLQLVVQKTGYPQEMLDLDLDLEADLGIDTVKQAEMFAAIRETYGIPRDDNRKLRDYPTLAHVIRFVYEKRPDLSPNVTLGAAVPAPTPAPPPSTTSADAVREKVLALVVEKTGYPQEMLDLDLDLEADLGIDTVKQAEMFAAIRETYGIPRDENRKLRDYPTLAHVIRFVYEKRPDLSPGVTTAPAAPAVAPVPTPAPAATAAMPVPPRAAPAGGDEIQKTVLAIVSEKTGYPAEMLDLDLDLEADLGIDTVKQAEMFAAVRAAYGIPRDENLKLRDFPTLAHVIQFARDRRAAAAPPMAKSEEPATPSPAALPAAPPQPVARPKPASFEAADRVPRRVPVPVPRPPLELCKPTGVSLAPGCRVVVMSDGGGASVALDERLTALGVEVLTLHPADDAEALASRVQAWLTQGAIQGVYWLPALDPEGALDKPGPRAFHDALCLRVKSLFTTMRVLYQQIAKAGTFLVAATRLGGQHGYDAAGAFAPLGGAVTGFVKTYKRERGEALVKAVDFEAGCAPSDIADRLIGETLRDPGVVEVGYQHGQRWTVGLREVSTADGRRGMDWNKETVFVVSGAAGSIVSAIVADLASASGGAFYLLDLAPEPDPKNPDLRRFVTDRDNLKRDLFARIQARGERATPALVERELAGLERQKAACDAMEAVRASGGKARYFQVDLTDAASVARAIDEIRRAAGKIDVLLHAAGLERSHFLPDKPPREFDLVFDVKADGWFNLLHAIGDMPLGATVAFSSIAGRFGNPGQADYAAANDLLCKLTSSFRTARPQTRAIAIDWTAWGGIGMATRGSIPKMMEQAGIDMLPPEAGIPLIRRELTTGAASGEIVIGQRLGMLLDEFDPSGGVDIAAATADARKLGPMVQSINRIALHGKFTVESTLDPKVQPFLYDHQIDGTPVLPGVMGIEAFAEAAACLLPDWRVAAVEEVEFLAPLKFYRSEPRTISVETALRADGDDIAAECRLVGRRLLPGQAEPQATVHFTGRVRLTRNPRVPMSGRSAPAPAESVLGQPDIYRAYFHGPAYQVIGRAWRTDNSVVGEMPANLPPNHRPADRPLLFAPRLVELCFQTAGLWEMGVEGHMGLPRHIDRVRLLLPAEASKGRLFAVVTPHPEQPSYEAEVVDGTGNIYLQMSGYSTVELPGAVPAEAMAAIRQVMESCELCPI